MFRITSHLSLWVLAGGMVLGAPVQIEKGHKTYKKIDSLHGNLNAVGSDTLNNLMAFWEEKFTALYPRVNIQIEGKGSSTAPPALIESTAQLGPMSRKMKPKEMDAFEKKFGYKPTAVKIAMDALSVYVHKDNHLQALSLQQVDSLFSSTRKRGGKDIRFWEELGLKGKFKLYPVSLYGRNSASGTYGYFKKVVLKNGDYKVIVKEQPGSSAVVQGIGNDLYGIGYSGVGYKTSGVKALDIGSKNGKVYSPSQENCIKGLYPLSRFLYIYVNKTPGKSLNPLTREFLRFILSRQGQEVVAKEGYYPIPAKLAKKIKDNLSL